MLPDAVERLLRQYLASIDDALPGVVEALYVVGSTALDDFQPGVSDVDFIAVTPTPVDARMEESLASVHAQVGADGDLPALEGPYVTFDELRSSPARTAGLFHHEGSLETGRSGRTPVEWLTLARHGIAIRGPEPASVGISTDPDELTQWTLGNLEQFWEPWVTRSRAATPTAMTMLTDWGISWGVLGVSRLHYTLRTGHITSKTGAGHHALFAFPPAWRDIVHEALRCRPHPVGPPESIAAAMDRRDEAIAFMEFAIEATRDVARQ